MTGYGKAECILPGKKLAIEIKSLNSKQMDANIRLPSLYREKELEIRQMIAANLERGKVECTIFYEPTGEEGSAIINEPVVKEYYDQLSRISGGLGLNPSLELLSMVMRMPDAIRTQKPELDPEEWNAVRKAIQQALEEVILFRDNEGKAMGTDLRERVAGISDRLSQVEQHEQDRISQIRNRIDSNLNNLVPNEEIDKNRFEQELIFYIEKLDVSEEKVRLGNHCAYFLETMQEERAVGKKLGFISQEMGREINTLGSKANHVEIQRLVVEMKDELEKIKEQILNIL
jgi:uncharacterized protein (TIGR00255 family)